MIRIYQLRTLQYNYIIIVYRYQLYYYDCMAYICILYLKVYTTIYIHKYILIVYISISSYIYIIYTPDFPLTLTSPYFEQ